MISIRRFFAFLIVACFIGCAAFALAQEQQEGRLMLFPDIHQDKIAFTYAGDIWVASSSGGVARRITSNPGRELFPKFSPDGKWLAFTGQYDGNFNVYVMPADGGQPKQLTYYQGQAQPLSDRMGILNEVIGWTPDGKSVIFLSRRDAQNGWTKRPFTVSVDGGLEQPMPVDKGGLLSFSPDGTKIAYNRIFRNFRQWKRYTGGMAQDITIFDIKNNAVDGVIPHTEYTDTFPMWHGNTIYFTSDRGPNHRLNLYSYDESSKQVEQLTKFDEFDIMWPSLGPNAIIFENAGYLYTFDLQSRQPKKLTIYLDGERDRAMKHWESAARNITDFDISPDGKRAVFAARGDVFTVPAKEGSVRNLTHSPGGARAEGGVVARWEMDCIHFRPYRRGRDLYRSAGRPRSRGTDHQRPQGVYVSTGVVARQLEDRVGRSKTPKLWYVDIKEKKPVEVDHAEFLRDHRITAGLLIVSGWLTIRISDQVTRWYICMD